MACKLTASLENKECGYAVAGVAAIYLANWYKPVIGAASVVDSIAYTFNVDGYVSAIHLPTGESWFKLTGSDNTMSFADALLLGGNNGKYRQHTINAVVNQYDIDVMNQGDALSLGKFVAIVIDAAGRIMILGRTSGLGAPAGGFDYNSGTATADATGWTLIQQGVSMEIAPLLLNATVITPIYTTEIED